MADETPSAHSTRWLETSRGILRYSELAPLLAERVLRIQERIEAGDYAIAPLDENLIRTLHRDFCGDPRARMGRSMAHDGRSGRPARATRATFGFASDAGIQSGLVGTLGRADSI